MTENVLVLGASGCIGREVVAQLLQAGHRVTAVARDGERLQELTRVARKPQRLSLLPGSLADEAEAERLVRALREQPHPITAVVASLRGARQSGRLLDQSGAALQRAFDEDVVTHFIAAKHLLPLLAESRPEGLYLLLGGPMASCAWSGYGHVSIAGAALHMLTKVLREEAKELPVTVQQLQVGTPVRTRANAEHACPEWIGAEEVARCVVWLIEHRERATPVVQLGTPRKPRERLYPLLNVADAAADAIDVTRSIRSST